MPEQNEEILSKMGIDIGKDKINIDIITAPGNYLNL